MGWGASTICSTVTSTGGDGSIGVLTLVLAAMWAVLWLGAFYLLETKRHTFAFAVYCAGLFSLLMAVFTGIDSTAVSNPATSNMLQMFVFPLTWLLVGSIIAFILFIFLGTLVKMAQTFGLKIHDWWYDGRY
jgi:hypothetical protein